MKPFNYIYRLYNLRFPLLANSENQIYLSSTSARHYSSSSSSQTKILRSSDAQERKRRRSEDAKFFDSLKDVEVSVIDDSILKITLDRPHRMNALSEKMGESIIFV